MDRAPALRWLATVPASRVILHSRLAAGRGELPASHRASIADAGPLAAGLAALAALSLWLAARRPA